MFKRKHLLNRRCCIRVWTFNLLKFN
jgi:hypothetical protein